MKGKYFKNPSWVARRVNRCIGCVFVLHNEFHSQTLTDDIFHEMILKIPSQGETFIYQGPLQFFFEIV